MRACKKIDGLALATNGPQKPRSAGRKNLIGKSHGVRELIFEYPAKLGAENAGQIAVPYGLANTEYRRKCEQHMNSFPNYMATVDLGKAEHKIHFVGLFSEKPDAIPLVLFHGWPGTFL